MSTDQRFEFPHLDITVGISGRPWNNEGPAFSFATLYTDTSTPFLSKDSLLATHTAYYKEQSTNRFFRLVKPLPGNGENRVSLDSERDYTWVNSSEKIVECYDDTDVWKIYISPGYYLLGSVNDTYTVTGVYSKPLIATEGHANCTFEHKANGDVIVNGIYQSTNPQRYAFNENLLYQSETDTVMRWRWAEEYKNDYCACINHVGGTLNDNKSEGNTGNCLVEGTQILLGDGTYTNVENIKAGDEVAIINHETGELDVAPITFNDFEPLDTYDVVKLNFSNGEEIELVYEHGFFDLDRNEYVYIRENNYQDYIGHRFYTNTEKGYATLLSGSVEKQYTRLYSPVSYFHCNYFTGSLLSMPGGITGLFNIFDIEDNSLKYDQVKKQADIEEFGLFTYEDFKDYATEEMFSAFPTKYFKVAIGKGLITMEHIMYLIERYACKCN